MTRFNGEQYQFVVEWLAEGKNVAAIRKEFARRWDDTDCQPSDIAALERSKLSPDWQAYFDAHRIAFIENAPLRERALRIAALDALARDAIERNSPGDALKYIELIEKIDSGFFKGKAVAIDPGSGAVEITEIRETIVDPTNDDGRPGS